MVYTHMYNDDAQTTPLTLYTVLIVSHGMWPAYIPVLEAALNYG